MPPRTRSKVANVPNAPRDRVYISSEPPQQKKFKPKRLAVYGRRSLGNTGTARKTRQQTLTQIDFVNRKHITDEEIDKEIEEYEKEERARSKKRRRTEGDQPLSSSKYETQTLTQIDFAASTALDLGDEFNEENIFEATPLNGKGEGTPNNSLTRKLEILEVLETQIQPQTPKQKLSLEIPSSQSPATPFSIQSYHGFEDRSALRERSPNIQLLKEQNTPKNKTPAKIPKLEIDDTFKTSPLSSRMSSFRRGASSTPGVTAANSPLTSVLSPEKQIPSTRSPSLCVKETPVRPKAIRKQEIEDSDAETEGFSEEEEPYEDLGPETQYRAEVICSSLENEIVRDSHPPLSQSYPLSPKLPITYGTQTQALYLSGAALAKFPPQTDKSDIITSIHPEHISGILSRSKTHEFRNWPIPSTVARIWLYETSPTSAVTYMMVVGPAKTPGEIGTKGSGNESFNAGNSGRFAYEILEIYELMNPLELLTAKQNGWLNGAPQKYVYAKDEVLEYLIANLRPPVFLSAGHPASSQMTITPPQGLPSDSQEAEQQLRSTMVQFSSRGAPAQSSPRQSIGAQSSPFQRPSRRSSPFIAEKQLPRASQATTVGLTQTQYQSKTDDAVPFGSSQRWTYSQLLPDSLMNDSIVPPPMLIEDSAGEEEEEDE
jgi:hypothetical protein